MTQDKQLTDVDTIAFQGGMDTYHEPGLLAPGSFSMVQNMRQMHPGLKQRAGYIKKHSTADSTNGVMSMFQFSKGKRTERHFYAQMTDGDVLEATDAPPTVTTGAFGTEVFDGSSGTIPASWSVLNDLLIYSNGVDQHQICAGTANNVYAFFENDMNGAEELMTLTLGAPATAWAADATITGATSKQQCTVVKSLSTTSYYVKRRTGAFHPTIPGYETLTDGTTASVTTTATFTSLNAMSDIHVEGINYTSQITDSSSSTVAVLDTIGTARFSEGTTYNAMAKTVAGNITETTLTGTGTAFLSTLKVGQPINIHAAGVLTFDGTTPSDGDTITLDSKTYTFKTALTPSEGEVLIGISALTARNNLVSAIMHTGTPDTDYKCAAAHTTCGAYSGNDNTTLTAYYLTAGTGGNVITTTENGTHTLWAAGTLLGGAESNVIDTITSNTVATVKTAWAATFSGGVLKTTHDYILVLAPIMPSHLTWTVSKPNGTVSTALISYYTATGWKNLTITDNTASSSKTLAQTGTMTWTTPTDAVPNYMYGLNGFWLKIAFTAELDAEVEISSLTYGSAWNSIQNVWDGGLVDAIEAIFYDASGGTSTTTFQNNLTYKATAGTGDGVGGAAIAYPLSIRPTAQKPALKSYIYGTTAIAIGGMDSDNDLLSFSSADPIIGVYIDVGSTPNTTVATTIDQFEYLSTSGAWKTVGTFTDNTNGLANSGYVTFNRPADISPVTYNGGTYNAYWYRFGLGGADCAASITIGIQVIPYYDINDFGKGLCNAVWEHRAVYVFDKNPNYIYLSTPDMPQVLSGSESGIFPIGDGRQNKIVCMKNFYDALLIFQEEKGAGGGCVSLLTKSDEDGAIGNMTSISTYYGTMNANCVEVIEAIEGGHRAFFLSRNGVMMTDGKSVSYVPNFDKIKNYFDTTDSDCIRTGYESKMYLKYDSVFHVLKIGLTTGASATNNNIFLVYDLHSSDWSLDSYANNFQCECEADAGSGNAPVVRLAGGQADGTVYILNSGVNDISTAVTSYVTMELSNKGRKIRNCELVTRVKTQTAGNMTIDMYRNGVNDSSKQLTRSLTAERTNDRLRKHRDNINWVDQNLSVKFAHSAVDEGFYLLDYGVKLDEYSEQ